MISIKQKKRLSIGKEHKKKKLTQSSTVHKATSLQNSYRKDGNHRIKGQ